MSESSKAPAIAGNTSNHIRRKNDYYYDRQRARNAHIKKHGVEPPPVKKKKPGRKPKRSKVYSFQKPAIAAAAVSARRSALRSSGASDSVPDLGKNHKSSSPPLPRTHTARFAGVPTSRVTQNNNCITRSNAPIVREKSTRKRTAPELFHQVEFAKTRPTCCPPDHYHKTMERQKNIADMADVRSTHYKKMYFSGLGQLESLRSEMRKLKASRPDHEIVDRPNFLPSSLQAPMPSNAQLRSYVKTCLSGSQCTQDEYISVFQSLDLERFGTLSKVASKRKVLNGMQRLFDYHFVGYAKGECADILGELLFNGELFGKRAGIEVATTATRSITSAIFSTVNLLRSIDTSGGALNDSAISQYARIEKELGMGKKGSYMLHNRRKITHVRNIANRYIKYLLNVKHDPTCVAGDRVYIDPARAIRLSVDAFGLREKAINEGIEFAVAGDAAQVTTTTNADQCCVGGKHVDVDARLPTNKEEYMFTHMVEDDDGILKREYKGYQSTDICIPCTIVEAKEGAAVKAGCFDDFYKFIKRLEEVGLPADGDEPAFKPFKIISCGDMAYLQKMIGMGGACKVKKLFCMYCACHGDHDLFFECFRDDRCWICKQNGSTSCTHQAICDKDEIERVQVELCDILLEDFKTRTNNPDATVKEMMPETSRCYNGVDEKGEMVLVPICLQDQIGTDGTMLHEHVYDYLRDVHHIEELSGVLESTEVHLHPARLSKDKEEDNINYKCDGLNPVRDSNFRANMFEALELRGQDVSLVTCHDERVELLRSRLELAEKIRRLRNTLLQHESTLHCRIFDPGQSPLCVLHAFMRMTEKIVQQIFLHGLRDNISSKAMLDAFIANVEKVMREEVFAHKTSSRSSSWKFPLSSDRKLEDINLSNTKARKIAKMMHSIIYVCISGAQNEAHNASWKDIASKFLVVGDWIDSKQEFSAEEVCAFQHDADEFCTAYFGQAGRDGMTNYFHALRAGHFSYFLLKYKNLYRLSQQGWENVNSRLKRSYHHNSAKGGGRGGSSKLLPVMYNLLREMMWKFGHLDGLFKHIGHDGTINMKYKKIERMPIQTDVTDETIVTFANMLLSCSGDTEPNAETEADLTLDIEEFFRDDTDEDSSSDDEEDSSSDEEEQEAVA